MKKLFLVLVLISTNLFGMQPGKQLFKLATKYKLNFNKFGQFYKQYSSSFPVKKPLPVIKAQKSRKSIFIDTNDNYLEQHKVKAQIYSDIEELIKKNHQELKEKLDLLLVKKFFKKDNLQPKMSDEEATKLASLCIAKFLQENSYESIVNQAMEKIEKNNDEQSVHLAIIVDIILPELIFRLTNHKATEIMFFINNYWETGIELHNFNLILSVDSLGRWIKKYLDEIKSILGEGK